MERTFKVGERYRVEGFRPEAGNIIEITHVENGRCSYKTIKAQMPIDSFDIGRSFSDSLVACDGDASPSGTLAESVAKLREAAIELFKSITPEYTAKVVCVNSADSIVFEKGVIYTIENGIIKGRESQFDEPIKTLGDLNRRSLALFIEVVE